MSLAECLAELAERGCVPASAWPGDEDPGAYGLVIDGGQVVPVVPHDPLRESAIRAALTPPARNWLKRLEVVPMIGSTNAELMDRARREPVAGTVCLAELQVQGRGRRGRSWSSPFGANLAVSIGLAVDAEPARLGGVSLVVGLAVLEALEGLGARGLSLKWPNDVLLADAKVGGILIEAARVRGTELVAGIGLNVRLPDALRAGLPSEVADLDRAGLRVARSGLAAAVISAVVAFVGEFDRSGFAPFQRAFDARHAFSGRRCDVLLGDSRIAGTVKGVSDQGELVLETETGLRTFHSGEVSLRQQA